MDKFLVENRFESSLDPLVKTYVHAAVSDNTRRAYRSDLRHFLDWGGTIPASDGVVGDGGGNVFCDQLRNLTEFH